MMFLTSMNRLLLLLTLLFCSLSGFATHQYGIHLFYDCIETDKYEVFAVEWQDCSSSIYCIPFYPFTCPLPTPNVQIRPHSQSCSYQPQVVNWRVVYRVDITPVCPTSSLCSPAGSFAAGAWEYLWQAKLDLSAAPAGCQQFELSWATGSRNNVLTSGAANSNLYIGGLDIDLSLPACNNAARMVHPPVTTLCAGDSLEVPLTMIDPDGDSLVYAMINCMSIENVAVGYNPGFSPSQPLGTSWDFQLDSLTGILNITPAPGNIELGPLCYRVEEYRNGVKINTVTADMNIIVQNCTHRSAPRIDSVFGVIGGEKIDTLEVYAVAGIPLFVELAASSTNNTDTVLFLEVGLRGEPSSPDTAVVPDYRGPFVRNNQSPDGIRIATLGQSPFHAVAEWTPPEAGYYPLSLTVHNGECPIQAEAYSYIKINVDTPWIQAAVTPIGCGTDSGAIDLTLFGNRGPYSFAWSTGDATEDISGLVLGLYDVEVTDRLGAKSTFRFRVDSIYNTVQTRLSPNIGPCDSSLFDIDAIVTGGFPPYRYLWNTGDSLPQLSQALSTNGYSVTVTDSLGCSQHTAINYPSASLCYNSMKGFVYHDVNNNCERDSAETGVANTWVSVGITTVLTDSLGFYDIQIVDSLVTAVRLKKFGYLAPVQCPFDTILLDTLSTNINVPLVIDSAFTQQQDVSLLPQNVILRPGIPHWNVISLKNSSLNPFTGTLAFYPDSLMMIDSMIPLPDSFSIGGDSLYWKLNTLPSQGMFLAKMRMKADSQVPLGTPYIFHATALPDSQDVSPLNNTIRWPLQVQGSFDPNDKQASPPQRGSEGWLFPHEKSLIYTIRFQNTGTDTAFFVTIRDTLDTQTLLPFSTEVLGASHPYRMCMLEDSILECQFDYIMLPDSMTDPEGSMGYVHVRIDRKERLPYLTHIQNRAAIYFDFNKPIITNLVTRSIYQNPDIQQLDSVLCLGDSLWFRIKRGASLFRYGIRDSVLGQTNKAQDFGIQIDATGTFLLKVEDEYGFTDTLTVRPDILPSPNANFTWTIQNDTVYFEATGLHNESWNWDFGDGATSRVGPRESHVYSNNGPFTVSLITSNQICGEDSTASQILLALSNQAPIHSSDISAIPNPFTQQTTIRFSNPSHTPTDFELYDITGKVIKIISGVSQESFILERRGMTQGLYFLKMKGKSNGVIRLMLR